MAIEGLLPRLRELGIDLGGEITARPRGLPARSQ
jgi:hypothetical protein